MKNLKQLREERASKVEAAQALFDTAKADNNRSLTEAEKTQVRASQDEIKALDSEIEMAEVRERLAAERAAAGAPIAGNHSQADKRDLAKFSLRKMALGILTNSPQTGLEAEMSQEAEREAKSLGITLEGRAHIPGFLAIQQRDNSVTMPTQPEDGSAVVYDEPAQAMQALLRPELAIKRLGARVLTGLTGDVPFPAQTTGAKSTWKEEVEELDKSNIKFRKSKISPHRLGTYILVSKQFLVQTSPDIEAMLRDELRTSVDYAVDRAAIYGTGLEADNEPLGLLNTEGVYVLSGGTNGRIPTLNDIVALEASVEIRNAATGKLGYLMNSKIKGTLKTTPIVAGQPLMLLTSNTELNGQRLVISNIVEDQTRGTATQASAIAYGDWSQMVLGQWGGLDLMLDPYTLATKGQNRLIIQSWWDILARRAESFALMVGAIPNTEIGSLQQLS